MKNDINNKPHEVLWIGLAVILGEQKDLKLVFLNGCANKNQVQTLMRTGYTGGVALRTGSDYVDLVVSQPPVVCESELNVEPNVELLDACTLASGVGPSHSRMICVASSHRQVVLGSV